MQTDLPVGILTNTFQQTSLDGVLDAIASHGLRHVQFDLNCAGLPSMPDELDPSTAQAIAAALAARRVTMSAVSGTFNMIHPDAAVREAGLRQLQTLAGACKHLGASVITLCTGTRNPESMWRRHPDNDTPAAWRDLVVSMQHAAVIAEQHGVTMAFEPEVNNTADSAQKARRLIDEVGSKNIQVVMDGANIFHAGELPKMNDILKEAFDLLGSDIALAHAKDLDHDGDAGHLPAGHGKLDYPLYLSLLKRSGYAGPIILHGLGEDQVDGCVSFLKVLSRQD
jgi:sugar phosphate isomerase/epimerase